MTAPAKAETIWGLYREVTKWTEWDKGIVFAALPFRLTDVEPRRGFSDVTEIPGAGVEIRFAHRLEPVREERRSRTG